MSSKASRAMPSHRSTRRVTLLLSKPTILVAEDSADSREMMKVLLQMKGYKVVAAENGVNALAAARKKRPDAVLLDLQLPIMDGLDVTRNLRSHPTLKKVPIIIVTGHDPNRYRQAALDAGCDEYLMKPINFEALQTVLDRLVPREQYARVKFA